MSEAENVELVRRAYAAFNSGDIPAVIQMFAPDAEWRPPAVKGTPHAGPLRGREEITKFFERLAAAEEVLEFRQDEFVAQGDRVVVFGTWRGRPKSTGRTYETPFVHAFTVRAGKLQEYQGYWDTAVQAEAFRL